MNSYRSTRIMFALMGMVLIFSQLNACSAGLAAPAQVSAVEARQATERILTATARATSTPTLTRTLVPSQTATPTRTITPTITPTPNIRETYLLLTEAATRTICRRYPDTWQFELERALLPYWCKASGIKGSLYEYEVYYPSEWSIKAFGDLYRHLLFVTGRPNTELRLYQVFSYYTRKETYTLDEAPQKARFYDDSEKAFAVMNPLEKVVSTERTRVFSHEVMVVDSLLGELAIRRYFFFVMIRPGVEGGKHLFYLELSALKTLEPEIWQDLIEKTEYILTTVQPLFWQ